MRHRVDDGLLPREGGVLGRLLDLARELLDQSIDSIDQIVEPLEGVQERQRRAALAGGRVVEPGLGAALAAIAAPTAFLDFETIAPAIPVWNGCAPYQVVPMQFSVHRESAAGVEHREWLADGPGDPRLPLAVALLDACAGASSVVVYSGYENTVIRGVADALPALAHDLHALAARLVDLLPIVRDHVYDSKFEGSFNLKRVLRALVGQGYDDLAIAVGGLASVRLDRLLFRAISDAECADLRRDLLAYCARDTSGLVLLLGCLRRLAAAHP